MIFPDFLSNTKSSLGPWAYFSPLTRGFLLPLSLETFDIFLLFGWIESPSAVSTAGVRFTTRTFCNLFFLAWMPNPFSFPKHNSINERKNESFSPICCLLFLFLQENLIYSSSSPLWLLCQKVLSFSPSVFLLLDNSCCDKAVEYRMTNILWDGSSPLPNQIDSCINVWLWGLLYVLFYVPL